MRSIWNALKLQHHTVASDIHLLWILTGDSYTQIQSIQTCTDDYRSVDVCTQDLKEVRCFKFLEMMCTRLQHVDRWLTWQLVSASGDLTNCNYYLFSFIKIKKKISYLKHLWHLLNHSIDRYGSVPLFNIVHCFHLINNKTCKIWRILFTCNIKSPHR